MSLGGVSEQFSSNPPPYTPTAQEYESTERRALREPPPREFMSVNLAACLTSCGFAALTIGSALAATVVVNQVAMVVFVIVAALFGIATMAAITAGCDDELWTLEQYYRQVGSNFVQWALPFLQELTKESGKAVIRGVSQRVTDGISGRSGVNMNFGV